MEEKDQNITILVGPLAKLNHEDKILSRNFRFSRLYHFSPWREISKQVVLIFPRNILVEFSHVFYCCKKFDFGRIVCHVYGYVGFVEGSLRKLYSLSKPKSSFNPLIYDSILKLNFISDLRLSCRLLNEDAKRMYLKPSIKRNGWLKYAPTGKIVVAVFHVFNRHWTVDGICAYSSIILPFILHL